MELWPNQTRALDAIPAAIAAGYRRILVTSPTGTGKSVIISRQVGTWGVEGHNTSVYSNRRMLTAQLARTLDESGLDFGIRASGYKAEYHRIQLCSIQTEHRRCFGESATWEPHPASRVLIDEAHVNCNPMATQIVDHHIDNHDAVLCGITATPIDLGAMYDHLIIAGTMSEGRKMGALITAITYGIDEPDMRALAKKTGPGKDLTEKQCVQLILRDGLYGRVIDAFRQLNPDNIPSIGFGPSVAGSLWLAQQFQEAGINAAHIDGESIWIKGEWLKADNPDHRQQLLDASRSGDVKIVWNRFVLREAIDMPWLGHGVLATIFGSPATYMQAVGRLLRKFPGMDFATLQDHGGNWWRHASPNADRQWRLTDTSELVASQLADMYRDGTKTQPKICPQCKRVLSTRECPSCGWKSDGRPTPRAVVQQDGTLKLITKDPYSPKRITKRSDGPALWKRMYHRCRNRGATFRQGEALFAMENNWGYPDRSWPYMPLEDYDFYLPVTDVPWEKIRQP